MVGDIISSRRHNSFDFMRRWGMSGSYGRGGGGHLPPIGRGGGAEKCIQCIFSEQGKHMCHEDGTFVYSHYRLSVLRL